MHVDATVSEPFSGLSGRLIDIMASVNAGGGFGSVDHLVQTARNRVAGADSASITSYRRGRFTTTVASDDLSRRGDSLQYELGSGPCVDAVVNGTVYGSGDVAVDDRGRQPRGGPLDEPRDRDGHRRPHDRREAHPRPGLRTAAGGQPGDQPAVA